ncbi:MAG: glycosyltransferase family 2 protein [Hyphomonas sp.]|nr:glycosyltransferase family 2 protein [Hyphomonas sp.]
MSTSSAHLSVVIPFYNEFENAAPLFERLLPVLNSVSENWEVICVDDGSDDDTLNALIEARKKEPRIRILKLSRNFGKEAAVSAGLQAASGQQILLMDGDLQHPPETLTEMLEIQTRGIDVVYGLRRSRKTEGRLRSALSSAFYRMFSGTSDVRIPADAGDFRLMSRRVVDALNNLPEQKRFMKGLYAWVGFSQQAVLYDVEARRSGKSKWSISQLFGYAWNGVMSFSAAPLRMWSVIGICIAALAVAYAIWVIATTLIYGRDVPGYATLVVAIFFLGGLQLLSIGVLGEYIARIFAETKQRPLFIIEEKRGFESDADE